MNQKSSQNNWKVQKLTEKNQRTVLKCENESKMSQKVQKWIEDLSVELKYQNVYKKSLKFPKTHWNSQKSIQKISKIFELTRKPPK